ncbi:MAG TPA: hypothetical protein VK137_11030 [Planctomycetaceae bacterium]|nr:hypothetical protein [Planctomycetaceae bacterium]
MVLTGDADKEQFELLVTAGVERTAREIPNISLRVEATGLGQVLPTVLSHSPGRRTIPGD